jgi:Flp pilus assembly protein TadD
MNEQTIQATTPSGGCGFPERTRLYRPWVAAVFLLTITFLAYLPAITTGGFIWDDNAHVTNDPLLLSLQGLCLIWTKVGPAHGGTPQYYPLTFSVFWAEYHLFQLRPLGYHLVNVLLHAVNAILAWRILKRLRVPGALLAAAIFAVHPVCVESVAWISELKNVLSGLCYLLSLLYYIRFLGIEPAPQPAVKPSSRSVGAKKHRTPAEPHNRYWPFYFLSVFLFFCALGGKSVTASLPAVILLILWWKTERIGWKNLLLLLPMLLASAGLGLATAGIEKYQVGANGAAWSLTPLEHLLVAGRILCFYAGKLIWPFKLMFIYPRWEIDQAVWWQYLFPLAAAVVAVSLWSMRKKTGRGPLAAALFFAVTLAPVLALLNVYPMLFSYVADHYQYLASLGPIALFSAGATSAWSRLRSRADTGLMRTAMLLAGALLLALGLLTWRQAGIYKNGDQVWNDTIKKNPGCWMAYNNLGISLARQGKVEEAIAQYREALRLKPDYVEAHMNLGLKLSGQGKLEEAIAQYREALRLVPGFTGAHYDLGVALARQGKFQEAIVQYCEVLRLKPDYAEARNAWGVALAEQGKVEEAIVQYREALRLKPDYAEARDNLQTASGFIGKRAGAEKVRRP